MNAPCKGCPDRVVEPNCHMTCERYKEFQAYRQAIIDSRRDEQECKAYQFNLKYRIWKTEQKIRKYKRFRNTMN